MTNRRCDCGGEARDVGLGLSWLQLSHPGRGLLELVADEAQSLGGSELFGRDLARVGRSHVGERLRRGRFRPVGRGRGATFPFLERRGFADTRVSSLPVAFMGTRGDGGTGL